MIDFYKGKRVLVTGHTGFKGSWLCRLLTQAGAQVTGFALAPPTSPSLFEAAALGATIHDIRGDIRDSEALAAAFNTARPEIVIHMAAQPIVRDGYQRPAYTYETNVMGTVNVLECVRQSSTVTSVIIVTTDKVYLNREQDAAYREDDVLDGYDPYSNSKSCADLATHCYVRSFFTDREGRVTLPVSTVRSGNVIGGGDFAPDRIIPDCVRAVASHQDIIVRHPHSTRPYQHVLEPLYAYLLVAERQQQDHRLAGSYNVGPDDGDCLQTGRLVSLFTERWGDGARWVSRPDDGPHEANLLRLDSTRLKTALGWQPRWNIAQAMDKVVEWSRCWIERGDVRACMDRQIDEFLNLQQ